MHKGPIHVPVEERFWDKVDTSGDCWLWMGARQVSGHGVLGIRGSKLGRAHRVSYELCIGPIPPGMSVCHRCDNPPCVRPDHLFLGSQADNIADMKAKGRAGHANYPGKNRGSKHGMSRFTETQVADMKARMRAGEPRKTIMSEYQIGDALLSMIATGKRWAHVA